MLVQIRRVINRSIFLLILILSILSCGKRTSEMKINYQSKITNFEDSLKLLYYIFNSHNILYANLYTPLESTLNTDIFKPFEAEVKLEKIIKKGDTVIYFCFSFSKNQVQLISAMSGSPMGTFRLNLKDSSLYFAYEDLTDREYDMSCINDKNSFQRFLGQNYNLFLQN
jgi:hypothetical protein